MALRGNAFRRMTVADRMKAGLGAVGPNHPNVRAAMLKGFTMPKAAPAAADESENSDNPTEEGAEGQPPNYREAEECGMCVHFDGNDCKKYNTPVEEEMVCDDFERGGDIDEDERRQSNDEEENADQSGEY